MVVLPSARFSWKAVSVHSPTKPAGSVFAATSSIALSACPDETSGRRPSLHSHRADVVVADQSRRTDHDSDFDETPQRDHLAVIVANVYPIDVVDFIAVVRFRLHLDLPTPPIQIDVVDVVTAKRGLQGLEYSVQRRPEDLGLVAIDIEKDRRIGRRESREDAA